MRSADRIDPRRREATLGDRRLELRAREFDCVRAARDAGLVLTRDTLLEDVWGTDLRARRAPWMSMSPRFARSSRRTDRRSRPSAATAIGCCPTPRADRPPPPVSRMPRALAGRLASGGGRACTTLIVAGGGLYVALGTLIARPRRRRRHRRRADAGPGPQRHELVDACQSPPGAREVVRGAVRGHLLLGPGAGLRAAAHRTRSATYLPRQAGRGPESRDRGGRPICSPEVSGASRVGPLRLSCPSRTGRGRRDGRSAADTAPVVS